MTYLDRSWTWSQWHDRVRRLTGALRERGVGRGDVVAFLDKNHPACVELTFAAAALGAATAIVNFRLAADEIDYVLTDSGARLLVVGTELMGAVEARPRRLARVEHVVEVTAHGAPGDAYEEMLAAARPPTATGRRADRHRLVMYSSGTTGRPRA